MRKLVLVAFLFSYYCFAQVQKKVGDNAYTINSSAVFEVESTTKGLLLPRMTTAQRDAITSPAEGLVIYNTTTKRLETNLGSAATPIWTVSGGSVSTWTLSVGYAKNELVVYTDGQVYRANAAIPANTAWAIGTTGATWAAVVNSAAKTTNLIGGNNTTLLGAMPYQSNIDVTTLLAPNTTTTKKVLTQTGTGTNGAAPVWGTLVAADIPTLNQNTTGTAANVTGTVAIANGGSGQTTQQAAINALTGTQSSGKYLRSDGTNATLSAIAVADVPTLNQNTTGSAGKATNLIGGNNTTLLGAIPYQSNTDVTTLLAPNTTTTKKVLTQTGTGTNGAVPVWETFSNTNIYSADGSLAANRTVSQADKTLAFTSTATTGTSHFTVDGTTFNVDTVTNRVGIGTSSPQVGLEVKSGAIIGNSPGTASSSLNSSILNAWSPSALNGSVASREPVIRMTRGGTSGTKWNMSADFLLGTYSTGLNSQSQLDIRLANGGTNDTDTDVMTLRADGKVGINTTNPSTALDVNGQIKISGGTPGTGKVLTSDTNGLASWQTAITPKVTLQTSSTTKPTSPNAADVLIVTSDGTATGLVKEVWNYTGTSWVKTQGTDDVSGAILDNTITDPATITTAGRYIVPASGVSGVFVGNEKKFADFDGTSWTLFTTPADATTVIITTGTNTGQTWKYTAATSTWTQVVSGAISIYPWVLSGAYTAGTIVNYQGNLYQANGAVPANTAFTVGTTGATWSAYLKIDDKYTLPANPLQVASGQSIQEAIGNLQGFINRVPTVSPDPSVAGWWKLASWTPLNAGGHDKYAAFMITMIIKGSYGTTVETLYVTINNANPYGYTMMLFPGSRSGGGDIAFTSFAISSDALYGYYNAAAGRSISANVLLLSSFGMTDPPKVTLVNTGSTAVPSGVGGYLSANGNSSTLKNMTGGRLYTSANNSGFAGGAIAYENGGGVSNINDTNASLNDATATYVYTGLTAARTFTLPDPTTVTAGKIFILKNATANTSSITAVGTVDGAVNPILISSAYGVRRLISNGIVWLSI